MLLMPHRERSTSRDFTSTSSVRKDVPGSPEHNALLQRTPSQKALNASVSPSSQGSGGAISTLKRALAPSKLFKSNTDKGLSASDSGSAASSPNVHGTRTLAFSDAASDTDSERSGASVPRD